VRTIKLSRDLDGYLEFPHAHVVFQIERRTSKLDGSEPTVEVGVTSLTGTTDTHAAFVSKLVRGHWTIENRLHWIRDVAFREDLSQIRTGNGPRMMASLRNLAISLLRLGGASSIEKALRWCARDVSRCLRIVGMN
jgi:Transposase DDE domain